MSPAKCPLTSYMVEPSRNGLFGPTCVTLLGPFASLPVGLRGGADQELGIGPPKKALTTNKTPSSPNIAAPTSITARTTRSRGASIG